MASAPGEPAGTARGRAGLARLLPLFGLLAPCRALIVVPGAVTWLRVCNVCWVGAPFTADPRAKVYGRILGLSPSSFEGARTGEVISRLTSDVTLVIAHRLATVRSANRIVVTDHGRVVVLGTHDSLVREDGLFARPAVLQFAATSHESRP